VRAALESIPFQIKDVIVAMEKDAGMVLQEINTDGGITENKMVMQFLSDLLNIYVATIGIPDVSALGAALLAGLKSGVYKDIEYLRKMSIEKKYFRPLLHDKALTSYQAWQKEIEQYENKTGSIKLVGEK
jgi:glycerol kinase